MEIAVRFGLWLMDNCQIAEDNSLWEYDSEEFMTEQLFEIFYKDLINSKEVKNYLDEIDITTIDKIRKSKSDAEARRFLIELKYEK